MKRNDYYRKLSLPLKKEFRIRVLFFIQTINFTTDSNFKIFEEMQLVIASGFVQITFGLKKDMLTHFNKIVIASKPYSYKHLKEVFIGDVNPSTKTISLTWPSVASGFRVNNDGVNLAIHEFSHCLILENSYQTYPYKILDTQELKHIEILGQQHLKKDTKAIRELLRSYAKTNMMEFVAVSIEEFFERPKRFFELAPKLYLALTRLLNQDPRNHHHPIL